MSENNNNSSKLSAVLELNSTQYRAEDHQKLVFTLNNKSNETLSVLKWRTPLEGFKDDMFNVRKQDETALYLGKIVKRGLPKPKDYITLEPNGSASTEVILDEAYDITGSGNYAVKFVSPILHVGEEEPAALAAKFSEKRTVVPQPIASNTVEFKLLEDRGPRVSEGLEIEFKARIADSLVPTFSNCSNNQESQINQVIPEAERYAKESQNLLASTLGSARPNAARYKEWFGIYTAQNYGTLNTHFDKIAGAVTNKKITFNCTCDEADPDNTFAYVYPGRPYEIFLCNLFWTAPLTGTDSKAGTIIHELSHFYVVAGTSDTGGIYGQNGCRQLALRDPQAALGHADSHEYFAENNPRLLM
ncbi:MAG TPA: M35 family metallo-endopeptidase [Nitrososphaeraceae archaeon]|jgi:peptidyl-Lys metalloendopeptidase|nr:M35 family metallo-endopeptidase [Nitrososphaeraceae archaeon]